jgi:EAL and modified HD-GYP domain-containing signal transduction protein
MDDSLNLLPKEHVGIELLETIKVTPKLIDRCRFLKANGFTLALDDHKYSEDFHELYQIVDIVKVDLVQTQAVNLSEMISQFRRYPIQLIAEKVETQEEFRSCINLGFDMFQGYYFAKPSIIEKKRLDESSSTMLKLIRLLSDDADLVELEKTIRGSAGLTYKLLILVNSVSIGSRNRIETIRHAITLIGRQQIQRWVQLALFAGNDNLGLENPLVDMAAVRASIMENLARHHRTLKTHHNSYEKAYMTGILSILEKVYAIPMDEVIHNLNLSEDVRDALISHTGDLGQLLHIAELLELMETDHMCSHLEEIGLSLDNVIQAQLIAYSWRKNMIH